MPDESDGGTPSTFTQDQLDTAVKEAKESAYKEGQTAVWSQAQSDKDKGVAAARTQADQVIAEARKVLDATEEARLKGMTEEEQRDYKLNRLYEQSRGNGPGAPGTTLPGPSGSAPEATPRGPAPSGPGTSTEEQATQAMQTALKEAGIDPSAVDLTSMPNFVKSLKTALTPEQTDEEKRLEQEKHVEENRVDTSRSTVGSVEELTKMDPATLIREGRGGKSPWQRVT